MNNTPSRPALRYHGSKWLLAPWIIKHIPPHELYCEPYGGAAAVLLRKPRSKMEVYNDLDSDVVNFFSVLRSHSKELIRSIILTPFAKEEYTLSQTPTSDPIEHARRFYIRSHMSIAGPTALHNPGWRRQVIYSKKDTPNSGMVPAAVSFSKTCHLWDIAKRFKGITIEHDSATNIINRYDTPNTCFYIDPPYPLSTRSSTKPHHYAHDMTDTQHTQLSAQLHDTQGSILVSSYRSELYDELYADWHRFDKIARISGRDTRTESLWLNTQATTLLTHKDMPLFNVSHVNPTAARRHKQQRAESSQAYRHTTPTSTRVKDRVGVLCVGYDGCSKIPTHITRTTRTTPPTTGDTAT